MSSYSKNCGNCQMLCTNTPVSVMRCNFCWAKQIRFLILLMTGFFCTARPSYAQDLSAYMKEERFTCVNIDLNCKREILRLYGEHKSDSIYLLASFWNKSCPEARNGFIGKALAEILTNRPSTLDKDTSCSRKILDIQLRKKRLDLTSLNEQMGDTLDIFKAGYAFADLDGKFDEWVRRISDSLWPSLSPNTLEWHFMKLLSSESYNVFEGVDQYNVVNAKNLLYYRNDWIKKVVHEADYILAVRGGVWLPQNGLSGFGTKGYQSFQMGIKVDRHNFLFSIGAMFIDHKDSIRFKTRTANYFAKDYFTLLLGADYHYEFLRFKNTTFYASAGYAISGVSFYRTDRPDDEETAMEFNNNNFGAGLGVYFYPKKGDYFFGVAVQQQYAVVVNNGIGHFSGYPVLLTISYGFATRNYTRDLLKQVNYTKPH